MSQRITFTLDSRSVGRSISDLQRYRAEFIRKCNELLARLTEEGVNTAKLQVAALGAIDTGELADSIEGYFSPSLRCGFVRAGAWYAIYVEYGTGVVGANAPHPNPAGWAYDVNGHGENGWVYQSDRDGKFHWTKGQPSRPFMHNTMRELERTAENIAREVFGS